MTAVTGASKIGLHILKKMKDGCTARGYPVTLPA